MENSEDRKPLIIKGARQVGKTWLMQECSAALNALKCFKEKAIEWLVSAGMLNRIYNVSKPEHPLPAFDQLSAFKLFVFDTGLLKQMAGIDNSAILLKTDYQFKGPLTENYLLQQLKGQFEVMPRYFADNKGEIDFVLQDGAIRNIPLYLAAKTAELL